MKIRKAHSTDRSYIVDIYGVVADAIQDITRRPEEITNTYIFSLLNKPEDQCIFLVVEDDDDEIIAFAHAEKIGLAAYNHILTNYIIAVSPDVQNKGYGRGVFMGFLEYVFNERPDIQRLEMEIKHDPDRVKLFEATGFTKEAVIKNRARAANGEFYDQVLMAWINPNFKP